MTPMDLSYRSKTSNICQNYKEDGLQSKEKMQCDASHFLECQNQSLSKLGKNQVLPLNTRV